MAKKSEHRCRCVGWRVSWPSLESAQVLAYLHGQAYKGRAFRFCPWCGRELPELKKAVAESSQG